MPIVAFDAAVSAMLCGVPGVSASVAGLAVTPVGSPLSVTFTVPVKLLSAVAFIEIGCPGLPAVIDRLPGDAESAKSGAAVTVSAVVAVWLKAPELPVRVTVALPIVAFDAAVSVMLCGVPGVSVRVVWLAVTPAGSPRRITFIGPVNPFNAVALTAIDCPGLPGAMERSPGETARVKSGAGATVNPAVAV